MFPLLSYLVVIPLCYPCRLYLVEQAAWMPALLYVVVPNTALITLHLGQYLFPLVAWTCAARYARARVCCSIWDISSHLGWWPCAECWRRCISRWRARAVGAGGRWPPGPLLVVWGYRGYFGSPSATT